MPNKAYNTYFSDILYSILFHLVKIGQDLPEF
jgi:hypothetical protein